DVFISADGLSVALKAITFPPVLCKFVRGLYHLGCCLCGKNDKMHVHHIKPFSVCLRELDFVSMSSLSNLVVLCGSCHLSKAHKGNLYLCDVEVAKKLRGIAEGKLAESDQKQYRAITGKIETYLKFLRFEELLKYGTTDCENVVLD